MGCGPSSKVIYMALLAGKCQVQLGAICLSRRYMMQSYEYIFGLLKGDKCFFSIFAIMLGKKNKGANEVLGANLLNIIGIGTEVNGDIASEGDLRVDGKITGNVVVKQRLVLGAGAIIKGNVKATNAIVTGDLEGNIVVGDTLLLKDSSYISGDISTNKLIIESGARFNGKCSMNVTEKIDPTDDKKG